MNYKLLPVLFILAVLFPLRASDISGFWKSMDDNTGRPAAVIGIYEYRDRMFGRLIITYNDGLVRDTIYNQDERAEKVTGTPFFAGMDFIWDLESRGDKWVEGRIMDPQEGKIYNADLWMEGDMLVVRGKIKIGFFFIGRSQKWLPIEPADLPPGFILPDLRHAVPRYYEMVD